MSVESLIFFVLVLIVWGLSVGARWLQAQMEKGSSTGVGVESVEWSPRPALELMPKGESLVTADEGQTFPPAPPDRTWLVRQKKTRRRLGLGSPQTLRQGIILMTILGPCRALEPSNDTRSF